LAENAEDIVVADVASTDGSASMVRQLFPTVKLLALQENRGFGWAANQAIAAAQFDYILLLNSDTLVTGGTLTSLSQYLESHPQAAIVGPRLREGDGRLQQSCYPFPGTLRWMLDNDGLAPLNRLVGTLRRSCLRVWNHDRERVVPWIKGAAMAIRRSDFERAGGFDEDYFLYFEETELCARLARLGRETHFAPVAEIIHLRERSTSQYGPRMMVQLCDSMVRYFRTHFGPVRAGALTAVYRTVCSVRLLRQAWRQKRSANREERQMATETMRGFRRVWLGR